jgi:Predicted transcription factor, homolog of eukaryotic MBF1
MPSRAAVGHRRTWRSEARSAPELKRLGDRLGSRIRELRQSNALTQEEASTLAQLDVKHWQEIESGESNPTLASLAGIARALNVKLSKLLDGIEE